MKVKELMIPISEYVTVDEGAKLLDVFLALEKDYKAKGGGSHAHRDVLVLTAAGEVAGTVTMVDIVRSMEPNYNNLATGQDETNVLTKDYVASVFKDLGLWAASLSDLCGKAAELAVDEVMHKPQGHELVDENDPLELAMHQYMMGVRQPVLVTRGKDVVGVLRFSDIFEEIRKRMLACG